MSTLSRFRPDEFTIAMLATVALSLLLPCQGTSATVFEWLTAAAIALLFFLQGARLSRGAILAGALHWRLHLLVFTATFVLFPIVGLMLASVVGHFAHAAALSRPAVPVHVAFDRAGVCCLYFDRRRQCRGGAVQRLGVEHHRHVYDAAAGELCVEDVRRFFVGRAAVDRGRDAASVHRRAPAAAMDRALGDATAQGAGLGRSRFGVAGGLYRVQRRHAERDLAPARARTAGRPLLPCRRRSSP